MGDGGGREGEKVQWGHQNGMGEVKRGEGSERFSGGLRTGWRIRERGNKGGIGGGVGNHVYGVGGTQRRDLCSGCHLEYNEPNRTNEIELG